MATIWAAQEPASHLPPEYVAAGSLSLPMAGGQTCVRGDILTIASGVLSKAATNPTTANLAGMALKGSVDVYTSATPSDSTLFGASTVGTALTPSEPNNMQFYPCNNGNRFIFSYLQALSSTTPGTACGLLLDASGYFVLDNTQGNKPWIIEQVMQYALAPFQNGDTYVRVLAYIPTSTAVGI